MDKTTETRNEYQAPATLVVMIRFAERVLQNGSPGDGGSESPEQGESF